MAKRVKGLLEGMHYPVISAHLLCGNFFPQASFFHVELMINSEQQSLNLARDTLQKAHAFFCPEKNINSLIQKKDLKPTSFAFTSYPF